VISYFNALRSQGLNCTTHHSGCRQTGAASDDDRTAAILGLLPAALSTKIGGQTAQPLAIVVVGG